MSPGLLMLSSSLCCYAFNINYYCISVTHIKKESCTFWLFLHFLNYKFISLPCLLTNLQERFIGYCSLTWQNLTFNVTLYKGEIIWLASRYYRKVCGYQAVPVGLISSMDGLGFHQIWHRMWLCTTTSSLIMLKLKYFLMLSLLSLLLSLWKPVSIPQNIMFQNGKVLQKLQIALGLDHI